LINLDTSIFDELNLIRSAENRNKPRGDLAKMKIFNDCILGLDLVELPFNGRTSLGATCNQILY
jgi:hypothetical protein